MGSATAQNVFFVLGTAVAGLAFILLIWGMSRLLRPDNPTPEKDIPFECGMDPAGPPWAPVDHRFAIVALLFVVFDAESALLFAVATGLRGSWVGVAEVAVFTAFLALGLAYAWRKGALEWLL